MYTREHRALRALPVRHRFHVRMTALYGSAVLLVLAVTGIIDYRVGVSRELDGLRDKVLAMAIALATTLDADELEPIRTPADVETETYQRVYDQFRTIALHYPSIDALYVMRPLDDAGHMEIVVDYTRGDVGGNQAMPGTPYDGSGLPVMIRGTQEPAVEQKPWRDEFGLTLSGYAPLANAAGEDVLFVGLDINAGRIDVIKREVLSTTAVVFGISALVLAVVGILVGRMLRPPLTRVMFASNEVANGNFKTRVEVDRNDEFGRLGENFNDMAIGLEEREFIRDTFGRYVSEDVATTLLSSPELVELGGEEREVTVLLSDIRGYSTISEELSPTQVVSLLNEYLGAMNEIIDRYRGCVIEYLGDGILAVFGAPNAMRDHAEQAVNCAIAMRDRLAELNRGWEQSGIAKIWQGKGFSELKVRVGLHSGTVVAGNLGSAKRMKYAVTGDTVNLAARLEQLNKRTDTEILLSTAVHDRLSESLSARAVDRGSHQVKGRAKEVHVYSI